jgi:hypothetical protein
MKLGLYEFFLKFALEKGRKERKGKERKEMRRGSEPLSYPVRQ